MKKLALLVAATVAGLMFAAGSGEARMDSARRAELCPMSTAPLCSVGLPECGPHGWRCAAPTEWGQPDNRRSDACPGAPGPYCVQPGVPACKHGRWICQSPPVY